MPANQTALDFASSHPWLWRWISTKPTLRALVNRYFINLITYSTRPRPHPLSLWGPLTAGSSEYVSWVGLVDRTYTGRHLPPADDAYTKRLPAPEELRSLFQREHFTPCPKSTALFCFFAQWFTDSFLRTDPIDQRKNTSNHEIDLCQIYGLSPADTRLLRTGKDGLLKSEIIDGEEYPARLLDETGKAKDEFCGLSYIDPKTRDFVVHANSATPPIPDFANTPQRRAELFAAGLERGNSTIFYSAINTIFLREHNRLCKEIKARHDWDDDRIFETARNINIVQLLRVIIEDYINHLSNAEFKIYVDRTIAEGERWYRTNRISAEFNLLYRWHQLAPAELSLDGNVLKDDEFRFNNGLLRSKGVEAVLDAGTHQRAGRIMLHNTAGFLVNADVAAIAKARAWRLQSYNAYREHFSLPRITSFIELTGDPALASELEDLYRNIDDVEFCVGLLAERRSDNAPLGQLMMFMVGADAFSQALTNPLLSQNIYGEQCFSAIGAGSIEGTRTFADIVRRNTRKGATVSFTFQAKNPPGDYGLPGLGVLAGLADFFVFSGWLQFLRKRERKHGSTVFKANLFQNTIVALDHSAIAPLFDDKDMIQDYGFSWAVPAKALVGDVKPSIFEAGFAHDAPKQLYISLLQRRAATLPASFAGVMDKSLARWFGKGAFSAADEIEDLVATFVFSWMLNIRPDPADVRLVYKNIFSQFFTAITKHIPGSNYRRSIAAYNRLLAAIERAPAMPEVIAIARELGLTNEQAVYRQMAFVIGMNSFLGLQNLLTSLLAELSIRADLREKLRHEMAAADASATNIAALSRMPLLDRVIKETLRLHPPVTFVFGRAVKDRIIESKSGRFRMKKGELLMGVLATAHRDPDIFKDPDAFDPARYDDPRCTEFLIWPRGAHDAKVTAGDRICPGKDVALVIAKLFCVSLLQRADWTLSEPPVWDAKWFGLDVAAPKGPMDVTFREREARN